MVERISPDYSKGITHAQTKKEEEITEAISHICRKVPLVMPVTPSYNPQLCSNPFAEEQYNAANNSESYFLKILLGFNMLTCRKHLFSQADFASYGVQEE